MVIAVYVCLLAAMVFAFVAPVCARRLAPRAATWAVTIGGAVTGGAATLSLLLLSLTLVAPSPLVTRSARWSSAAGREQPPVPPTVGGLALALILLAAARALWFWRGHRRAARDAEQLLEVDGAPGELTVVDDPHVLAFAVPGRDGGIVITQGLLRCLAPAERQAVIAHERAHLRHHHHRHRVAARLVGGLVPVLSGLPDVVELTTERWADEDAAGVCTRGTVRSALLRVAAAGPTAARPAGVLEAAESNVLARVTALDHPRSTSSRRWTVGLAAVLTALFTLTAASAAEAVRDTHLLFARPQTATVD